jgi:hypothetical protein
MHTLGTIEDRMSPLRVAKKKVCCPFVLRLQEGKDVNQP